MRTYRKRDDGTTERGTLPDYFELHALRADCKDEGTVWYNPVSWGNDMKIGLIVSREGVPDFITDEELSLRVQYLDIGNTRKAVGIRTQERLIALGFVSSFQQFMRHKWGPEDFKTVVQWGKIAAWTAVGAVAIGIAALYTWHKLGNLGKHVKDGAGSLWDKITGGSDDSSSPPSDDEESSTEKPSKDEDGNEKGSWAAYRKKMQGKMMMKVTDVAF